MQENNQPLIPMLTKDIADKSVAQMVDLAEMYYFAVNPGILRAKIRAVFLERAQMLSPDSLRIMEGLFREFEKKERETEQERIREEKLLNCENTFQEIFLDRNAKGNVEPSISNFRRIMENDPYYADIRFNVLRGAPEIHDHRTFTPKVRLWRDSDESASMQYIEETYHIYSEHKHAQAFEILLSEREYNPIAEIIDKLTWDGVPRVEDCLHRWLKCDDNAYTREVSRLIFAGGINRLYNPGCKFDEVPVLVGTRQGEGKTTFVSWLALDEKFKSDLITFEGTQAMEQLQGVWICEIAELIALTKLRDKETAKAFITRQTDKYRKPWGHHVGEYPRRCIFIGTTNSRRFLSDKTGNRRFYPVEIHSDGRELRNHEKECREYILQCWAEACDRYREGKMPACSDGALTDEYIAAQQASMEDDWRVGAITSWLTDKPVGAKVCCRQLAREALKLTPDEPAKDPTRKESAEMGEIMDRIPGWERLPKPFRCGIYGTQRGWIKTEQTEPPLPPLPFKIAS